MRKHEGDIRCYSILSEHWYAKAVLPMYEGLIDEIMIGFYSLDGGTSGEFKVEWRYLTNKITPQLKVYDDSWSALSNFKDLLDLMAEVDGKDISPKEFCKLLDKCGIIDRTERTQQ